MTTSTGASTPRQCSCTTSSTCSSWKPDMSQLPMPHSQRGVALLVALVFLLATTLLALAATRSSRLELRMAQNEEARLTAVQQVQALAEAVIGSPTAIPVVGNAGYLLCTPGEAGCDSNNLVLPPS